MRIIKKAALIQFWRNNPDAKSGLEFWHKITKSAKWNGLQDVRGAFPHADLVNVKSGRSVVVFNVGGNKFRLITAIHYNKKTVYILIILTHKEYSKDKWKDIL